MNSERFIVLNNIRRGRFREDFECYAKVFEPYSVDDEELLKLLNKEVVERVADPNNPFSCCYSSEGSAHLS